MILKQTFDFEHVMRHCHLHDDPGVAGKPSEIFQEAYTRRHLLRLFGDDDEDEVEDIHNTKEKAIPYIQKFTPKNAVGAKQCCAQSGDWKFCIYSTEFAVDDKRVAVEPGRNCSKTSFNILS